MPHHPRNSRSRSRSQPRLQRRQKSRTKRSSSLSGKESNKEATRHRHQRVNHSAGKRSLSSSPQRRNEEPKRTYEWGKKADNIEEDQVDEPIQKPDFGLSGALAKDNVTGNIQNGIVMKWSEPPEARIPDKRWRLYVFKDGRNIETLHIHRKSAFLAGRDKTIADVLTEHPSCSKQHAVIQFRKVQVESKDGAGYDLVVRPYILDLNSTNGTSLNGEKIEGSRFIELKEKDVLKFGESTREYVLLNAS